MPHTLHDVRSIEDLAVQATRAALSQTHQRHLYSPDHAADFVSRLRGFVDATPHVIRYHRATQCFLDTAERLADKEDAAPQSLGYNLLEIFTEQPQLAAILELDPEFDPRGFWMYDTAENRIGLITSFDKDRSFVQMCDGRTQLGRTNRSRKPTD